MTENVIHTEDVLKCPLCGDENRKVLYAGLRDRLFGAPGEWNLKECCRCGLVFLDPRPTPEDVGKAYATYYTHSTSAKLKQHSLVRRMYQRIKDGYLGAHWDYNNGLKKRQLTLAPLLYLHPGRRADLDFDVMYLKAVPGGRLLDVGCGSGELIERLEGLGWQGEGVDFDEQAVRVARERGLKVHVGTLESQGYPDKSFDAVTMSHVIEHVHDPLGLLHECRRILKTHGSLVMVTPNASSLGHKRFKGAWRGLEPPRHLQIFTPSSLEYLVARAGFGRPEIQTTVRDAHGLLIASRSVERTGRYSMDDTQPWTVRTWARTAQLLEWAVLKVKPDVGEEIAVVLEKR